jgi:hypothetical protein
MPELTQKEIAAFARDLRSSESSPLPAVVRALAADYLRLLEQDGRREYRVGYQAGNRIDYTLFAGPLTKQEANEAMDWLRMSDITGVRHNIHKQSRRPAGEWETDKP